MSGKSCWVRNGCVQGDGVAEWGEGSTWGKGWVRRIRKEDGEELLGSLSTLLHSSRSTTQ